VKISSNIWEVGAVCATALPHPVFVNVLHRRAAFIALALSGWVLYFSMRACQDGGAIRQWGFRRDGLKQAFIVASAFAAVALAAMIGIAVARSTLVFRWQMLALLTLYPVWGTFQQLLVQGVFVRMMTASAAGPWPKATAALAAALLFGAVHLPEWRLVVATSTLGLVFTAIYLRWQNLWPLGLYHGWLGVFYYYWVLGRDPWTEIFGLQV